MLKTKFQQKNMHEYFHENFNITQYTNYLLLELYQHTTGNNTNTNRDNISTISRATAKSVFD